MEEERARASDQLRSKDLSLSEKEGMLKTLGDKLTSSDATISEKEEILASLGVKLDTAAKTIEEKEEMLQDFGLKVRKCEERSDELARRPYWTSTYEPARSERHARARSETTKHCVSPGDSLRSLLRSWQKPQFLLMNTPSFATHFARRSFRTSQARSRRR